MKFDFERIKALFGVKKKPKETETVESATVGEDTGDEILENLERNFETGGKKKKSSFGNLPRQAILGVLTIAAVGGLFLYSNGYFKKNGGGDAPSAETLSRTGGGGSDFSGMGDAGKSGESRNASKSKRSEKKEVATGAMKTKNPKVSAEKRKRKKEESSGSGEDTSLTKDILTAAKPGEAAKGDDKTMRPEPEKVANREKKGDETVEFIEKTIPNDTLSGKEDPIAAIDEKVVETRSYNEYLAQKLALLSKLTEYYKRKKKLEELMDLFKKGYKKEDEAEEIEKKAARKALMAVNDKIGGISEELRRLKEEIRKAKRKDKNDVADYGAFSKEMGELEGFSIFVKDGRYVAVVKTPKGERIFRKGGYYKGFKIADITSDGITFEKNGVKYIYAGESAAEGYAVVNIPLAGGEAGEEKFIGDKKRSPRKYVPKPSGSEMARMILDKNLGRR